MFFLKEKLRRLYCVFLICEKFRLIELVVFIIVLIGLCRNWYVSEVFGLFSIVYIGNIMI